MWLIQENTLLQMPEGAMIPPGFKRIKPPLDFEANPVNYRISDGRISALSKKELAARQQSSRLSLTQEEIARIKSAIEKGII